MNRTKLHSVVATLTLVSVTFVGADGRPATAAPPDSPYCSLTGMTTYEFDGGGDGTSWSDPDNWSGDVAPGTGDLADAYVCIPDDAEVEMAAGDIATVQALDTGIFSSLVIGAGAGLFVHGDTATRSSTIRGYLELGGALGGPGRIDFSGLMIVGDFSDGGILPTGSVFASDPCSVFEDVPPPACSSAEGILVNDASMNAYGGFDLRDGYDLVIHGALVPGQVGIGMSPGSRLVLKALDADRRGQVNIHGNADFYQIGAGSPRPVFVNEGILRKWRGGGSATDQGVTVITTAYQGAGEVWVEEQDKVIIADGSTRAAQVTAGSQLGSGPCRLVGIDCRFTTLRQRGKRQSAVLEAPATQPDDQRALVRVRPRPDLWRPGHLGSPYLVHADRLDATAVTPAIIELRYDGSLLRGDTWRDVQIFRQRARGEPWRRIRACRADGTPRGTAHACVDRRDLPTSSRQVWGSGGDAVLVVRTTVTSRWVGHRSARSR